MTDLCQLSGKLCVPKAPAVTQHVKTGGWQVTFSGMDDFKQPFTKQRRLPPCDSEFLRVWRHQRNGLEDLVDQISVVDATWGLGTHYAATVTPLREKEHVVWRIPSINHPEIPLRFVNADDIPAAEV
jgi:hypothetical protein